MTVSVTGQEKSAVAKILYVSDLDATLLRNDKTISPYTLNALNSLMERGVLFTYATARSYVSAREVIGSLVPNVPSIIYNGTFLRNNDTGEQKLLYRFKNGDGEKILNEIMSHGIYPLVYAYVDGRECFSYVKDKLSVGTLEFVNEHQNDERANPVCENDLKRGEIFHFVCIEPEEALRPIYDKLKGDFQCVLYKEQYSDRWWLEVHPPEATKANAIVRLATELGVDKIVCFGDGVNDISMFEIASESYAVANACEELKKIATGVIADNESDGVAKWLVENAKI